MAGIDVHQTDSEKSSSSIYSPFDVQTPFDDSGWSVNIADGGATQKISSVPTWVWIAAAAGLALWLWKNR